MISMMMSMILQPGRWPPDRENKGGEVHQHGEPSRDRLHRGFSAVIVTVKMIDIS